MYRQWRYDAFHFVQNDVARFTRNDAMFAITLGEADIISEGIIISVSVIICQRQTSFKKVTFVFVDKSDFFVGK